MRKKWIYIVLPVVVVALLGFTFINLGNPTLSPVLFAQWVEDEGNGMKQVREMNDFHFTMQYKPLEYVVVTEQKQERLSKITFEEEKKEIEELQYFTFTVATSNNLTPLEDIAQSDQHYQQLVHYMAWEMQKDFQLVEEGDTLPCKLYHFERNYGLAPYHKYVLAFENTPTKEITNKTLIYRDQLFGTGYLKFQISQSDIKNIPNLKLY